jgi:hypothetical protein
MERSRKSEIQFFLFKKLTYKKDDSEGMVFLYSIMHTVYITKFNYDVMWLWRHVQTLYLPALSMRMALQYYYHKYHSHNLSDSLCDFVCWYDTPLGIRNYTECPKKK